jgi:hypothetical protein
MFEVEAERITNTKSRGKFDNVRNIFEFLKARQVDSLGHLLLWGLIRVRLRNQ